LLAKSIAIIDDDVDIADLFKDELEDDGYTVVDFNDSITALNHIQENAEEFGLVISDYLMPLINGFEVCAKLIDLNPDLRVVYNFCF